MPRSDRSEDETPGGAAGSAPLRAEAEVIPLPRADRAPSRDLGAERAERLARLRAGLPGAAREAILPKAGLPPRAPGISGSAPMVRGAHPIAPRPVAADRGPEAPFASPRAAHLPAWGLDPFSGAGPVAGFAEAPRGFDAAWDPVPKPAPVPDPPAFLATPAPEADPEQEAAAGTGGLDHLPGMGPGLLWALGRAGITDLATLAALDPGEFADRLGPIGRLVPARAWIAAARAAREP
jgi:predicted flap endonuclease-1-like 5' DNA nuclease